jgi:hypothetical protein
LNSKTTYRVIGIHASGERVVISQQATREVADKVVNLIRFASPYKQLVIESEDGMSPEHFDVKN